MSGQYKVAWLCEALLVSRSGYYDWKERRRQPGPRQLENSRLRERIREEFARSRQTYGSPRLAHALGSPGRRNRIARLMRLERIFARQRSKYRAATTDSRHGGPIAPNRLQNLAIGRSNQVWVSDATAVLTAQGWLYLVAVLDVFTRRVIGWAMSQILDATLAIAALRMALGRRRPAQTLILHSDRGAQFASAAYRLTSSVFCFVWLSLVEALQVFLSCSPDAGAIAASKYSSEAWERSRRNNRG